MTEYLEKRQLSLSMEKTKVTHIEEGFDFLGFNLKQYAQSNGKTKLLIKPSKESVQKAKNAIKEVFEQSKGRPVRAIIPEINHIILGTGYYWNKVVSKKVFGNIDRYIWLKTIKYLNHLHPNKNNKWKAKRYFKPDHYGISKDKWILSNPKDHSIQLTKMTWIPIERHAQVKYDSSPDNPLLKQYFEKRDEREFNAQNVRSRQKMAKSQKYKCRICKQSLTGEEGLEINHIVPKRIGGKSHYYNLELLHDGCHTQHHQLMELYGGGQQYTKAKEYLTRHGIDPATKEGADMMKKSFRKFNYAVTE
jgi:RNA-directed DNA polymerase